MVDGMDGLTISRLLAVTEAHFKGGKETFLMPEDQVPEKPNEACVGDGHTTWTTFETTADFGIEVWAPCVKSLLLEAGAAFADLSAETDGMMYDSEHEIILEEEDYEMLLVSWLNELIYLLDTKHFLPLGFRRPQLIITNGTVVFQATALGGTLVEGNFTPKTEIKQATYHMLEVKPSEVGWFGRVVFDI